jgi:hypothetical protein
MEVEDQQNAANSSGERVAVSPDGGNDKRSDSVSDKSERSDSSNNLSESEENQDSQADNKE